MKNGAETMKVLIVDDHEVVRTGLRTLLGAHEDIEITGEAETAAAAVKSAMDTRPDTVLMDVRLPDGSGIEACRRIRSAAPEVRVLMLTSYSDEEAIFAAVMAGASGYLLKQVDADQLYEAILAVGRGESLLDPHLSKAVVDRIHEICEGAPVRGLDSLTEREKEILELIAEGLTNKEIAERVFLSQKTVRNYVSSIFQKIHVSHRTQAAIYYLNRKKDEDRGLTQ